MGATDSERIRKEAADAITSRPPASSDSQVDAAIRRYLGSEMYHALEHETPKKHQKEHRDEGRSALDETERQP